jgi:NAD(P)-dependent dehydrogenase (short-subunit alcohol dehydrogenase family)
LNAFAESTAWDVAAYGIETTILMPGVFTQGTAHFANAQSPADTARTAQDRGTRGARGVAGQQSSSDP